MALPIALVMIGMIVGNILGGLIVGNWPLTLGIFLGQVSTLFVLATQGHRADERIGRVKELDPGP